MNSYPKVIKILGAIAVIMYIIMIWYSFSNESGFDSIIIGAYFTVLGVCFGFIFTEMGKRFYDKKHNDLLCRINKIRKSQQRTEKTSKIIVTRLDSIDSRLEAIESKLESVDNDTESAPTGRCDEPVHSDHIGR